MKVILSIDGGGIRGIIPAAILSYIEQKIQEILGNYNYKLSDVVDFVAGTSAGSVIGSLMLIPNKDCDHVESKYSIKEIVDLYAHLINDIYKRKRFLGGIISPAYDQNNLETHLLLHMDHYKLGDLVKPCMFNAYDVNKQTIKFYTREESSNYYLKDIIKGSISLPSFFPPSSYQEGINFDTTIDAAVFINNPSVIAYTEILKEKYTTKDIFIISLGTGQIKKSYSKIKWGKLQWFNPLINMAFSAQSEIADYEMKKIFADNLHNYKRINPPIILGSYNPMDSSRENITKLLMDAQEFIKNNKEMLNTLAREICDIKHLVNYFED